MDESQQKVEAVLFAAGREMSAERIANLCSLSVEDVEKIVGQLAAYYAQLDGSMQVVRKEFGYKLTVKDVFVPLVSSIVSSTEIEKPLMETLAVVAWKYPVVKSEIVKLRGPAAYEHMRALQERGFIETQRFGRTAKIKLTKKFFEYFDLPSAEAKQAFLKQIPSPVLQQAEQVEKEAQEVERLIERDQKEKEGAHEISSAMREMKKEDAIN